MARIGKRRTKPVVTAGPRNGPVKRAKPIDPARYRNDGPLPRCRAHFFLEPEPGHEADRADPSLVTTALIVKADAERLLYFRPGADTPESVCSPWPADSEEQAQAGMSGS